MKRFSIEDKKVGINIFTLNWQMYNKIAQNLKKSEVQSLFHWKRIRR